MVAEAIDPDAQRGEDSSSNNDANVPYEQLFDHVVAFSGSPSAFETLNAGTFSLPPSNNSQMATDSFNDVDSNMWGSHAVDFSAFAPPQSSNTWTLFNQSGRNQQLDVRNGLMTPPHNNSPDTMASSASLAGDVDGVNPKDIAGNKKRNSRKISRTSDLDMEGHGSSGRKARKNSRGASIKPEEDELEGEDKREKFLERNRVAASKCRQKKKAWTNNLEEQARELTSERHALAHHVALLRNELLELKCKCLEHTNCDCVQIRDYLKNTVAQLNPTNSSLYQLSDPHTQPASRPSASVSTNASASVAELPTLDRSRQSSSASAMSTNLDFMKLEDDVRTTLADALAPTHGG